MESQKMSGLYFENIADIGRVLSLNLFFQWFGKQVILQTSFTTVQQEDEHIVYD